MKTRVHDCNLGTGISRLASKVYGHVLVRVSTLVFIERWYSKYLLASQSFCMCLLLLAFADNTGSLHDGVTSGLLTHFTPDVLLCVLGAGMLAMRCRPNTK